MARDYQSLLEPFFARNLERARCFVWSLTATLPEKHPLLIFFRKRGLSFDNRPHPERGDRRCIPGMTAPERGGGTGYRG